MRRRFVLCISHWTHSQIRARHMVFKIEHGADARLPRVEFVVTTLVTGAPAAARLGNRGDLPEQWVDERNCRLCTNSREHHEAGPLSVRRWRLCIGARTAVGVHPTRKMKPEPSRRGLEPPMSGSPVTDRASALFNSDEADHEYDGMDS